MSRSGGIGVSGFMDEALALAAEAARIGEVPVGAVIVDTTTRAIVARAHNRVIIDKDPVGHAELLAIRQAAVALDNERLGACDIYVTLEPCPMCAQAIAFARLRRLYFGAEDVKGGGVVHGPQIFDQPTCHHHPEIYGGIGEEKARAFLKRFFNDRRAAR